MSAAWVPAGPDVQCAVCHTPAFITGRHEDAATIWRAWGCPDEACPANSRARLGGRRGPDSEGVAPLGKSVDAAPSDWDDLDREGLLNAAWALLPAAAGGLVALGFVALFLRDLLSRT